MTYDIFKRAFATISIFYVREFLLHRPLQENIKNDYPTVYRRTQLNSYIVSKIINATIQHA